MPDSEGEEDRNARAKSPFGDILDSAKRLLGPATFYLQQRPSEPGEPSLEEAQQPTNGNDSSYDYAAEEQEFQQARRATHTRGRGRISTDNKAYKPSASDVEDDDDEFSDDGKGRRRRKKKKKEAVGLVNTLPSLNYDKRKRRKGKGVKGNVGETGEADPGEAEESDGEGSESDGQTTDKVMYIFTSPSLILIVFVLLAIHLCGSINSTRFNPPILTTFCSAPVGPSWFCPARPTGQ